MAKVLITSDLSYPIDKYIPNINCIISDIRNKMNNIYITPYLEIDSINFGLDISPDEDISIFNNKYSYVQSHCTYISSILMEIKKEIKIWNGHKNDLNLFYRKARNMLLTTKPEIKALRNKELQEAAIQTNLEDIVDLIESIDGIIDDLKYDQDIVSIKKDDLDKANVNLNRQQKVVEDEMMLGGVIGVRGAKIKARIKSEN
jgi:hypothetical protein